MGLRLINLVCLTPFDDDWGRTKKFKSFPIDIPEMQLFFKQILWYHRRQERAVLKTRRIDGKHVKEMFDSLPK